MLLWLALTALVLAGLVAWQRNGYPQQALAALGQEVLPAAPAPASAQAQPASGQQSSEVVLVNAKVANSPQSDAYTANLYHSTGNDEIPWPNVGGRAKIEFYTVQEGDTLWSIAESFELDIDTLRWSNPELERNPDILPVGTDLRILPVPGVYHVAAEGDTVESIAAQYGVAQTDITDYPPNALFPPYGLEPGQGIIVPYGRKGGLELPAPSIASGSPLAWPLVGVITQGFKQSHLALDIGAPYGSTVYAADDGTIVYADWAQTGYGYTIIIDHGDGRQTWYNHLKGTLLGKDNFVSRGTPIGQVGSTGHSTGPHLHFELRLNGEHVNPIDQLPGSTPQ